MLRSTLPTKSAPTSAAFVYTPPPSCMNRATNEAPNPYPARSSGTSAGEMEPGTDGSPTNSMWSSVCRKETPRTHMEMTSTAEKAPPRKHSSSASMCDRRAALATRMLARADTHMLT